MAQPDDDKDDKPLDPAVEKVRRKLVRFIAINLGLLFVALMAVVGAIVYKTRTETPPPVAALPMTDIPVPADGALVEASIPLPKNAALLTQSLSGNRLSLDVALPDGSRVIYLYDLAEKRMIGRYALTPQ
jgi:hypothetical protein